MKTGKWGNGLAVRLPESLVQKLGIAEGDEIELVPLCKKGEAPMTFAVKLAPSKSERLQAMRRYRAPFPTGIRLDRDEAKAPMRCFDGTIVLID